MNCETARRIWNRHIDGDACPPAAAAHLDECQACREFVGQLHQIVEAIEVLREETNLIVSVNTIQKTPSRRPRPLWSVMRSPLRVAAGLLIACSAYLVLRRAEKVERLTESAPVGSRSDFVPGAGPIDHAQYGVSITGPSSKKYLVVNAPSDRADVEIVWLYPVSAGQVPPEKS